MQGYEKPRFSACMWTPHPEYDQNQDKAHNLDTEDLHSHSKWDLTTVNIHYTCLGDIYLTCTSFAGCNKFCITKQNKSWKDWNERAHYERGERQWQSDRTAVRNRTAKRPMCVCVSCSGTGIVRIVTTKQLATLVFFSNRGRKSAWPFFLQPEKYNRFNWYLWIMTAKCLCNLKQQQVGKSSLNYSPARKPVDFCSDVKPELPHKKCLNRIYKSHSFQCFLES